MSLKSLVTVAARQNEAHVKAFVSFSGGMFTQR
jgi:hypothetical protein